MTATRIGRFNNTWSHEQTRGMARERRSGGAGVARAAMVFGALLLGLVGMPRVAAGLQHSLFENDAGDEEFFMWQTSPAAGEPTTSQLRKPLAIAARFCGSRRLA